MRKNNVTDQATNLFSQTDTPTQPDNTATPDQGVKTPEVNLNEIFQDTLSQIKNDQGDPKYSDVFTALNALKHTQDHVKTLEEENARFREEGIRAASMDEVLQQMTANQDQNVQTTPTGLDAESVKDVTLDTLRQYEAQKVSASNQKSVVEALTKTYGQKAEEMYTKKAQELGLDTSTFDSLAASSPKAVLSYFDVKDKETYFNPTKGSVNTEALGKENPPKRAPKNIMYGASTSDVLDAWRSAGQGLYDTE
jgi:hypothetical protein